MPVAILLIASLLIVSVPIFFTDLASGSSELSDRLQPLPTTAAPAAWNQTYASRSGTNTHYYGGEKDDWAYDLKPTSDGGTVMAGYTRSYGVNGSDMWMLKTGLTTYLWGNTTGTYQREYWNRTYGGPQDDGAFSVIQTSDGGYVLAGYTNSSGAGGYDMWLVKTDANGTMQWNRTYGGPQDDVAKGVIQTSDGGYLLVGYTNAPRSQNAWLVKIDASGNMYWGKILSGNVINAIIQTADDNYALAVEYTNAFGLVKVNSTGQIEFTQMYCGPTDKAYAQDLVQIDDGNFLVAGYFTDQSTGTNSSWLIKTDQMGNLQWSQTYSNYAVYGIAKTIDGGYVMTGDRACLIVTDAAGNVEWNGLNDAQTDENVLFTRTYALLESRPNRFILSGVQDTPEIPGCPLGTQSLWIQVDLKPSYLDIPPAVTIISPQNTAYAQRSVPLTFYVNDTTRYFGINGNNFNTTIPGNTTLSNLPNGKYNLTVYATDTNYNTGASLAVSFTVDSNEPYMPPKVTISSPTNDIYNTTQIMLNFEVDQLVFWAGYSLDGGTNMTAIPNANMALVSIPNGTHTLTVYAGNIPNGEAGYTTIDFTIALPYTFIPYYPELPFPQEIGNQIIQTLKPLIPIDVIAPLASTASSNPELLIIATIIVAVVIVAALFRLRIKPKASTYAS